MTRLFWFFLVLFLGHFVFLFGEETAPQEPKKENADSTTERKKPAEPKNVKKLEKEMIYENKESVFVFLALVL